MKVAEVEVQEDWRNCYLLISQPVRDNRTELQAPWMNMNIHGVCLLVQVCEVGGGLVLSHITCQRQRCIS